MCRVVPWFPLLGLTPSGLFMGLSSTLIYTSELILCSTILIKVVHSWRNGSQKKLSTIGKMGLI